jgi:hypothetical protein
MTSLTTGLILTILIQGFIIKHTSVNKRGEIPYESEFLENLVKDEKIHEARAFNFKYRYIDDVLSINNPRFAEFLPFIYPPELEIKGVGKI